MSFAEERTAELERVRTLDPAACTDPRAMAAALRTRRRLIKDEAPYGAAEAMWRQTMLAELDAKIAEFEEHATSRCWPW